MNRASLLSEALLAFCVNQGISASFLSSILLTPNSFLISFSIYISPSPHRPHFGYPGSNQGWTLVSGDKSQVFSIDLIEKKIPEGERQG